MAPVTSCLITSHHPHTKQFLLIARNPSHGDNNLSFSVPMSLSTFMCLLPSVSFCIRVRSRITDNPLSIRRSFSNACNSSATALVSSRNSSCASCCSLVCRRRRTEGNCERASMKWYGRIGGGRFGEGVLSSEGYHCQTKPYYQSQSRHKNNIPCRVVSRASITGVLRSTVSARLIIRVK
jgi:hypothetical protein